MIQFLQSTLLANKVYYIYVVIVPKWMMFLLELLVNDVDTESISSSLHLGDEVSDLVLSLNLLLDVLALQVVGQVGILMGRRGLVQLQQGLVHGLLQLEAGLDGLQSRLPFLDRGLGHILEDHAASTLILILDQLHGVLTLLLGTLPEPLGEAMEGHVITVEKGGLKSRKK